MLERNPTQIPEKLQRHVAAYERRRAQEKRRWPEYGVMLSLLRDEALTLEMIGKECGVSKERMRQVCDSDFPGVRPWSTRRAFGTRSSAHRERRKLSAAAAFKEDNPMFVELQRHASAAGLRLDVEWGAHGPLARYVRLEGKRYLVLRIQTASTLSTPALYAHCESPRRKSLAGCAGLLVLVMIRGQHSFERLYKISRVTFLAKRQTNVVIRLTSGGRRQKIEWNRRHLVSKLE